MVETKIWHKKLSFLLNFWRYAGNHYEFQKQIYYDYYFNESFH